MQRGTKIKLAVLIGFPMLVGLVLGANQTRAGAFLPWHLSIAYWVIISLATWWTLALATWINTVILSPWSPPKWLLWLSGGVIGSFAARYVIYVTANAFQPMMTEAQLRTMPPFVFDVEFARYYATNWSAILAMWIAACWANHKLLSQYLETEREKGNDLAVVVSPEPSMTVPPLFSRLPRALGYDIIALHSQDHYLKVYTKLGDTLILARLSDAIQVCDNLGITGSQVHRSWWVAHNAVAKSEVQGRKIFILLHSGIKIPVSQSYKELARRVGLLADDDLKHMASN